MTHFKKSFATLFVKSSAIGDCKATTLHMGDSRNREYSDKDEDCVDESQATGGEGGVGTIADGSKDGHDGTFGCLCLYWSPQ